MQFSYFYAAVTLVPLSLSFAYEGNGDPDRSYIEEVAQGNSYIKSPLRQTYGHSPDVSIIEELVEEEALISAKISEHSDEVKTQPFCKPGPGPRAAIGYRAPKGFGYDEGYTSFSTFLSPSGERPFQPFIDLRGHVFNDGRWAANAGLGGRYACEYGILGLNAYYDYRDSKELGSQNQVGGGLELLGKYVDLRINGYAPIGKTTKKECPCFDHFACNTAIARQVVAASLADIDGEIGMYIPGVSKWVDLYAAIGPYYLFEKQVDGATLGGKWGGRGRVSLKVYDGITIGGDITYDPIFNTRAQGWISLSFPFGPANLRQYGPRLKEKYPAPCDETARQFARMTQPVYRNEIIPIQNTTHCFDILKNCCSKILFVNNCSTNGNGTAECPFPTLLCAEQASQKCDVIYVCPGDGTSRGMNQGFVMKEGQRLISSATSFDLCDICIPACTPGCMPLLQNFERTTSLTLFPDSSFVVDMNTCTEVAGFRIDSSNPASGDGAAFGVVFDKGNQFTIRNNIFTNQQGAAIARTELEDCVRASICGNCINGPTPILLQQDPDTLLLSVGVLALNELTNPTLCIENNIFQNFSVVTSFNSGLAPTSVGVILSNITNGDISFCQNTFKNFETILNGFGDIPFFFSSGISIGSLKNSHLTVDCNTMDNFRAIAESLSGLYIFEAINSSLCISNNLFNNFNTSLEPDTGSSLSGIRIDETTNSTGWINKNVIQNFSTDLISIDGIFFNEFITNSTFYFNQNSFTNLLTFTGDNVFGIRHGAITNSSLEYNCNMFDTLFAIAQVSGINFFSLENSPVTFNCNTFNMIGASESMPSVVGTNASGIRYRGTVANSPTIYKCNAFNIILADELAMPIAAGIEYDATFSDASILFCGNTFNNIQGITTGDGILLISENASVTMRNNSFSQISTLDVELITSGTQTLCIENNSFSIQFDIAASSTTQCLRLFNNTNPGIYDVTGGINIESNNADLAVGLSELNNNQGTFNVGGNTAVPLDTCECSPSKCKTNLMKLFSKN